MSITVFIQDADEINIDRVTKLLSGIPGGVFKAVGSALKRAGQHGSTVGMRIVSQEYAITQSELKHYMHRINTIERSFGGTYEVEFGYRGNVIPLIKYDTTFTRGGKLQTRVLRSNTKQVLDRAFVAQVGGHTGVFERETSKRFPINELFGPSAVQAFYAHEETVDAMDEEIRKTYASRIEHEITRVLNGWGG